MKLLQPIISEKELWKPSASQPGYLQKNESPRPFQKGQVLLKVIVRKNTCIQQYL